MDVAEELQDEAWRSSLSTYAQVISDGEWIPYPHIQKIADEVQEVVEQGGGRLLLSMPPRHGKSELISKYLPLWFLERNPRKKVILTAYEFGLAEGFGRTVRDMAEAKNGDAWVSVRSDNRAASEWKTEQGGGMTCAGAGGPITGKGFHLGIIDDPIKNWQEASSPTIQKRIDYWMWSTFRTRCEPGGTVIGIMTRWNENDPFGKILARKNPKWRYIRIPAISEGEGDYMGRPEGEPLCPDRFSSEDLIEIKEDLPPSVWSALYQQRPAPMEGAIVQGDWIEYYESLPRIVRMMQSWDCSFKKTGTSFVVGQVWGIGEDGNFYLLDQYREKTGLAGTLEAIDRMMKKWPRSKSRMMIEDKANGSAVIETLQEKIGEKNVVATGAKGTKIERFEAVSPIFKKGEVFVPRDASWTEKLVMEWTTFPGSANDDQVDATSQALPFLVGLKSDTKTKKLNINMQALQKIGM